MANIKSAKKRVLVNKTKYDNNLPKKSAMKTAIKSALNDSSKDKVSEAYKKIDKAVKNGIIKKIKLLELNLVLQEI